MQKENFNRDWSFSLSGGSSFDALAGAAADRQMVDLPHDASIHEARNPEEPNGSGNGFFHENNYVYEKTFELTEEDAGKIITVEFEGVYQNSYVYVNNAYAANHPYGYSNYYVDITRFVHPGSNTIKVIVKNGVPSGRWYTGGGIYRDVHIMRADRLHLSAEGIHLSAESVEEDLAVIRAESVVSWRGLGQQDAILQVALYDAAGNCVAEDAMQLTLSEGETHSYRQHLYVKAPQCWSAEAPYLYTYRASILTDGEVRDTEEGTYGIRTLQLDPVHGLRVNGQTVKLRGGCLHHDNGVIGTAEFAHAEMIRVQNLKAAGFNAIRSSHYPMSRRLLEACDRLGMYVMDEFADVWTSTKVAYDYGTHMADWWEEDVANLVNKDYNHPCVIMYSVGNEIPETGNAIDVQWGKKLADRLRSLDDTRYTTNSMNLMLSVMNDLPSLMASMNPGGAQQAAAGEINEMMTDLGAQMAAIVCSDYVGDKTREASDQVDITGLNYAAPRYEKDAQQYPNRILVGSETYPMDLDYNWALVEKMPNLIGDFDWTAYDYLGEAGIGKISYQGKMGFSFYAPYPCKAAYCGDINLLGDARPVAYWRRSIWGLLEQPYIAVCPPEHYGQPLVKSQWAMTDAIRSWNWKGYEDRPIRVEVYADAEEIELLINGQSVGRQATGAAPERPGSAPGTDDQNRVAGKRNIAVFDVTYQPGTIEAVAYRNGQETSRDLLCTASENVQLQVQADRSEIPADGSDICYVELELVDENGVRNPQQVRSVSIEATGAGYVLGYGSADPESEENYYDTTARTYEGRLRAAIRANEPGEITVTFTSEGLETKSVVIRAV